MVLEIRTHSDKGRGGGLKIRDFGGRPFVDGPLNIREESLKVKMLHD